MAGPTPTSVRGAGRRHPHTAKQLPRTAHTYLVLYNVLSAAAWLVLLLRTAAHVVEHGSANAYGAVGSLASAVQTAALLEVAHAALGLVPSSVVTTAAQVASRIFVIHFVCRPAMLAQAGVADSLAWTTMIVAWSVTEVVRYVFYALALIGVRFRPLLVTRYSLFYVLYPLGASSEWVLIVRATAILYRTLGPLSAAFHAIVAAGYPYGLYVMMSHMVKMRRKALAPAPPPSSSHIN